MTLSEQISRDVPGLRYSIDDQFLDNGYKVWLLRYAREAVFDEQTKSFLNSELSAFKLGSSYLRAAREAQFMTLKQVASKMGVSKSAYSQIELSEARGTLQLSTLMKAAEALNCEVVFALRPKDRIPFTRKVWEATLKEAYQKFARLRNAVKRPYALVLASTVEELMTTSTYRRQRKWSERFRVSNT